MSFNPSFLESSFEHLPIGELCESVSERPPAALTSVVPINTSDVYDGVVLNHHKVPNESLPGQFIKGFKLDDILFSEIRPRNRRFALVDFNAEGYVASSKLMVLRAADNILPSYLYLALTHPQTLDWMQSLAEARSGTFPQITFDAIRNYRVSVPSKYHQGKITDFVGLLDNLISVNNRICGVLEEMAQALFKSWFVNFEPFQDGEFIDSELGLIPAGWSVGKLEDMATITMGQSPSGASYNNEAQGVLFYQGRTDFGWRFPNPRQYTTEPKKMANAGDILLSVRAPVGDLNITRSSCCIGRGIASIGFGQRSYGLYTLKHAEEFFSVYNSEGTIFGSINKASLAGMKILTPPTDVLSSFESTCAPLDSEIAVLQSEIENLALLRDSLLPKLMSGEIEIPE